MPKKLSEKLADAYQVARNLRNELHQAQQVNLPLHGQIVGLTNERDRLQQRVDFLLGLNKSYQQALTGLVDLVHAVAAGKTP